MDVNVQMYTLAYSVTNVLMDAFSVLIFFVRALVSLYFNMSHAFLDKTLLKS